MIDKYGREIDYLRISVTDRCSLRCRYCMPEEGVKSLSHAEILTYDEILRICRCAADLGIRKIKLTGGEPLVRKGCASLAKQIKAIPGIEKVTLTTNGILLAEQLDALLDAGIDAINISLDTLDPELFKKVARRDGLEKVFEGIEAALAHPGLSLKINSVPVIKEKENFIGIAGLAQKYPIHVRFIEMMPIGFGKQFPFQDEESIKAVLEEAYGPMHAVNERYGNGPCHYYEIAGFKGKIGFISAMTHKFCSQCNRVRLTSEGFMKGCLQYQKGTDLRGLMRGGCMDTIASMASGCIPLRGGSTTMQSGRTPRRASSAAAAPASAQRNSTFSMPFRSAFRRAFSIASGTISAPMTCAAFRARHRLIVPAPQYRSSTRSEGALTAYSTARSYSRSACTGLT